MEKLINDLSPAIQKLAEVFCVSVDYLQEHLMEYVLMYGKYHFINSWGSIFINAMLAGALAGGVGIMIVGLLMDDDKITMKTAVKTVVMFFVVPCAIYLITHIAPYLLAPEMYSIEAVLTLING